MIISLRQIEKSISNREKYLTREELTEMLKKHPIEFVFANVGDNLRWIPVDKCYEV